MCLKCKYIFKVTGDFEKSYAVQKPTYCPGPDDCSSVKFSCLSKSGLCFYCDVSLFQFLFCDPKD